MKRLKLALLCSMLVFCTACTNEDVNESEKNKTESEDNRTESERNEIESNNIFTFGLEETSDSVLEDETESSFSIGSLQTNLTDLAGTISSQTEDFIGAFSDSTLPVIDSEAALSAAQYLTGGHCWISCSESVATILYMKDLSIQMETITYDGNTFTTSTVNANWYITAGKLFFINADKPSPDEFTWSFEHNEDLYEFTITDSANHSYIFYELEKSSLEDGEEMAKSYLINQIDFEEITDYSTILSGYQGVSIVDAFIYAGLNPSYENRAAFAKELGIENYRGTAEQNLELIEAMGGTVG